MLNKLASIFSYTVLASVFGIIAGAIPVISFGIIYSATREDLAAWNPNYQAIFAVLFFSIPLFITMTVICAVRAYKKSEKLAILAILAIIPAFYGGVIFLLFAFNIIASLFHADSYL